MPLLSALNDKECLNQLHDQVMEYQRQDWVRDLAAQFDSVEQLILWIRSLEQRHDFGDPNDGPRLPCKISQRARFAPSDPNCFERLFLFLALALLIDPDLNLTSASLILDEGWHSFPVEMRNGYPVAIVLDPIHEPPRNTMTYTAWQARNLPPGAQRTLAPWFTEVARNACIDEGATETYRLSMQALRNALTTGDELEETEHIDHLLALAYRDAQLWGTPGHQAVNRVQGSLRNLALSINSGKAKRIIKKITETGKDIAPHVIRAALIAEFGPIAAVALQDAKIGVETPEATQLEPARATRTVDHRFITTFGFSRQEMKT